MLYVDANGNLCEPGVKAPIWGFGIPVLYRSGGQEADEFDIWAIPKYYFTNVCPDRYQQGTHPDDPVDNSCKE